MITIFSALPTGRQALKKGGYGGIFKRYFLFGFCDLIHFVLLLVNHLALHFSISKGVFLYSIKAK